MEVEVASSSGQQQIYICTRNRNRTRMSSEMTTTRPYTAAAQLSTRQMGHSAHSAVSQSDTLVSSNEAHWFVLHLNKNGAAVLQAVVSQRVECCCLAVASHHHQCSFYLAIFLEHCAYRHDVRFQCGETLVHNMQYLLYSKIATTAPTEVADEVDS